MAQSVLKKLPIGIQNFEELRTENYLYVDKTAQVHSLATSGKAYFLSRPRRFGKSMLCSTFKALFEGKKHLFQGTWIESSDWEWQAHPVIYLSFASIPHATPAELTENIKKNLIGIAKNYGLELQENALGAMLESLVNGLAEKHGQVVVLIDEYDKPIINKLQDLDLVNEFRKVLKQFYAPIKDLGSQLRFLFITGVSQFTQVSIFSDLNHLDILSNKAKAATICGYTEKEMIAVFSAHIKRSQAVLGCTTEKLLADIKFWYNGYAFTDPASAPERVYNPFSVINFFDSHAFENYWFKTGTPTFVIEYFENHNFVMADFEQVKVSGNVLYTLVPEDLKLPTLLYQTGYLTIKFYNPISRLFTLGFPNEEVAEACSQRLFAFTTGKDTGILGEFAADLKMAFINHTLADIEPALKKICSYIPSSLRDKSESTYQMIFYLVLQLVGLDVVVEDPTALGRIDAVIKLGKRAYIIELKIRGTADQALEQIETKRYDEKYRAQGLQVTRIGIVFDASKDVRTVTELAISE